MAIQRKDFFTAFLISLISSLVIGFSDVMISILFKPRFYSSLYMFAPLAITVEPDQEDQLKSLGYF